MDNSAQKPTKKIRAINFKHWENNTESELIVCIGSDASPDKAKAFLEEEYSFAWIKNHMRETGDKFHASKAAYDFCKNDGTLAKERKDFGNITYATHFDTEDNLTTYIPPVVIKLSELRDNSRIYLNEKQSSVRFLLVGKIQENIISKITKDLIIHRIKSANIDIIKGRFSERSVTLFHPFSSLDIDEDMEEKLPPLPSEEVEILPIGLSFHPYNYPYPKFNNDGDATGAIAHIDNLIYLLKRYGITIRYNVINKSDELILNDGQIRLIDNKKAENIEIVKSLCELNCFPISRLEHQLLALSNANPYNPVLEFCRSKKWDGIDRVDAVLKTIIVDDDLTDWRDTIIAKFMIAAVCAAMNDDTRRYKFKTVLTFQGEQGIGKTPWIKILSGSLHDYVLEGHLLNPDNKDSCITALTHWITELGELDATTKKSDVAAQKAFIDRSEDSIRLPYARTNSQWARRTLFFGTVNPSSFLVDNTGNDRFWCLPVKNLKLDDLEKIDMQQLWAQIHQFTSEQLDKGNREPWQLTKEEHEFQRDINESFRSLTAIEEAIIDTFETIKDRPVQWQANLSDILSAIGHQYASDKERASAKVWLERFFGNQSKYNGKRGWSIPQIPGLNDMDHAIYKMKKRGN